MSTVSMTKTYDAHVEVPGRTVTGSRAAIEHYITDDVAWAEGMSNGGEVPGRVTCNTNADRSVYFLVWHMDDGSIQVDTFTIEESA